MKLGRIAMVGLMMWMLAISSAFAQASGPATAFVREQQESVSRVLNRPRMDETQRGNEVTTLLNQFLDYDELAHRSLSDHWNTLDAAKRTEFVSLLRGLVERNYRNNLRSTLEYEISYSGESQTPQGIVVRTTARSRRNRRAPELSLDYTLRQDGTRYRVVDIATDGVSLVRNYRSQFNRIITRDGFDALLTRMRTRLAGEGNEL